MEDGKTAVQKLNKIFKEAEIDNKVIKNLGEGMKKLSSSASGFGDVMDGTKKHNKQMSVASENLEKINELYVDQIKAANTRIKITEKMSDNLTSSLDQTSRLHVELSSLSENLNALNSVYGSVLTAMSNKKIERMAGNHMSTLSPRQRMINMMYLVLTALLALNVSNLCLMLFLE